MNNQIDTCIQWIEEKDAHYLAKDDALIWFGSVTDLEIDNKWHSLTVKDAVRTIRVTKQSLTDVQVTDVALLTACQELGRVYELAVDMPNKKVKSCYFNKADYEPKCQVEIVCDSVVDYLVTNKWGLGFKLVQVLNVVELLLADKYLAFTNPQIRGYIEAKFEEKGFTIKKGSSRPSINGKKTIVAMMPNSKPSDVKNFNPVVIFRRLK